jgi:hypothetical protein
MSCDLCAEPGAPEWLTSLDPTADEPVIEAIAVVNETDGSVDAEAATRALVAAELVASAAGEAPDDLPPPAREWVERHGVPAEELIERALRAVRCVAQNDDLARTHDEAWHEAVQDLRFRLGDLAAGP